MIVGGFERNGYPGMMRSDPMTMEDEEGSSVGEAAYDSPDDPGSPDSPSDPDRQGGKEVRGPIIEAPTLRFQRMAPPRSPLPTVKDAPAASERVGHDTLEDLDESMRILRDRALARIGNVLGGRYEILNVLGTGAAGAVYSALDRRTNERVAVKLLHEGHTTNAEHVARFEREARAVTAIGHPSVVKVLEVARDHDGDLFMVLELLEGEALFYAIEEGTLSLGDVLEIGRQLLDALAAAHERGIVHRDVKPENIFLVRKPDAAIRVKLIDFGIAKILRRDHATTFSTLDGLVVGTPHYMSPQMCAGEPANEGADVWAAGAVLFHALAGQPPFDDANLGRLLLKIVRDRAPSIGRLRPDLPAEVVQAVDKALLPNPLLRWRNAREFHRALVAASAPLLELDPDELELEE